MYFRTLILSVATVGLCLADFKYEQNTRMTGGSMLRMMQMVSRAAKEPQISTIAVKGNKMVTQSKDFMQIVDLDAETTTSVNMKDQSYTVSTFAQTKAQMEKLLAKTKSNDANLTVDAKETGKTATLSGMAANEWMITMLVEAQGGKMRMEMSNWVSKSKISGYDEITRFQLKMVEKLGIATMASPMAGPMGQPGMAKGLAEAGKKMAAMGGVPVVTVTRMIPTDPEQVKQMEAMQGQQTAGQPTAGDAIASALGGRFGGFGKKKQAESAATPVEAPKGAPVEGSFSSNASMMEMTTESGGFSTQSVDPGMFAVPAGFKQKEVKGL